MAGLGFAKDGRGSRREPPKSRYARPGPYQAQLPPDQERAFRQWVQQNRVPFDPDDPYSDYDMRGYWQAQQGGDGRARTTVNENDGRPHYPDTYKTPYHRSFSNESRWATRGAPRWNEKDQLVDDNGNVVYDERAPQQPPQQPARRPTYRTGGRF